MPSGGSRGVREDCTVSIADILYTRVHHCVSHSLSFGILLLYVELHTQPLSLPICFLELYKALDGITAREFSCRETCRALVMLSLALFAPDSSCHLAVIKMSPHPDATH